jgi:uncharacterized protein YndB with AHSA1/START domain
MAVNEIDIAAPPEAVFDVLAEPDAYGHWVVGSSEIRDAEPDWPAPGSTFHHTQGAYGRGIEDTTSVIASNRPRGIVLEVRTRPLLVAKVELRLRPRGERTHVTMIEYPVGGIVAPVYNPLLDLVVRVRNAESLRRLRRLAEERAAATTGAAAATARRGPLARVATRHA